MILVNMIYNTSTGAVEPWHLKIQDRVRLGIQPKLLHHYQHAKTHAFSTVIL